MTRVIILCITCTFFFACSDPTEGMDEAPGDVTVAWPVPDVGGFLVESADSVEGFESGDLSTWGAEDAWVVGETDTGIARIVTEGEDFSIRTGEDRIHLAGDHALALQVTEAGGTAMLTSEPFVPSSPHLLFSQLSEVDSRGVVLQVEVLVGEQRTLFEVPVQTGGHRPGLDADDERIELFPEVGYDDGYAGKPVYQALDLGFWYGRGELIQVRFVQRSMVAPHDFFTLIDDICLVEVPEAYTDEIQVIRPLDP